MFFWIKWVRICNFFISLANRYIMQYGFPPPPFNKNILAIFRKGDSKLLFGTLLDYLEILTAKKTKYCN